MWSVEMVTLEYAFTGTVDVAHQKWAWSYLSQTAGRAARPFDVLVQGIRATGATVPPDLRGRPASFRYGTGLVALALHDEPGIAEWEKWNGSSQLVAGFALIGPYSLTGWFATQDGTIGSAMMATMFGVRDATLVRIDGAGAGFTTTMPRAMISADYVQTIVPNG